MSEPKPTDTPLEKSKRKIYLPHSGAGGGGQQLLHTLNIKLRTFLRPGSHQDIIPPFGIFFLAKKYNFKTKQPNNFPSFHSSSTTVIQSRSVPHTWSPVSAKTFFLLPSSSTAPLTAEPLTPSLCNTAWLHVALAARKNPSIATSKKTS